MNGLMNDGGEGKFGSGMKPESVEEIDFSIVRRGYEADAVKRRLQDAAAEIRRLQGVIAELSRRVEDFESTPVEQLESRRVAEALGDEAARLLQAARDAAQERVERAEAESEEIVGTARAAATAIVEEGRDEGREIVTEARRVRERMLADLARRHHTHRMEVEQLCTIRDRLLDSLSRCRRGLIEWVEELVQVGPQAVAAAERAGLRIAAGPEPTIMQMEAEIEAAGLAAASVDSSAAEARALDDDGAGDAAVGDHVRPGASDVDHLEVPREPVGGDVRLVEDLVAPDAEEGMRILGETADLADGDLTGPSAAMPAPGASADPGVYDVEAEPGADVDREPATPTESVLSDPGDLADPGDLSLAAPVVGSADAQAIFARLRAVEAPPSDQPARDSAFELAAEPDSTRIVEASEADGTDAGADTGTDAENIDADTGTDADADAAGADAGDARPPTAPDRAVAQQEGSAQAPSGRAGRSDELVEAARSAAVGAITQRLKRLIVEEQGELLDAIRREGADAVESILDAEVHAYARAVRTPLQDFASDVDISIDDIDLNAAGAAAVSTLIDPLRGRLKELLEGSGDSGELSSAVRSLYRDSRTSGSSDAAKAAFTAGWS